MSVTTEATPRPDTAPVGAITVGTLLVLAGILWLLDEAGVIDVSWPVAVALAVAAVGMLILATVRSPHAGGLVPVGIVLSVLLVLTAVVPGVPTTGGAGDRSYRPTSATDLRDRYELGAGTLVLDLTDLPPGTTGSGATEVSVGLGEISVLVPDGMAVDVTASAGTGEVDVMGTKEQGTGPVVREQLVGRGDPLELQLHVGIGSVEVRR